MHILRRSFSIFCCICMIDIGIALLVGLVIGLFFGMYLESGKTQRTQHELEHVKRAADKGYADEVKAIEKSLKKLKGKLGM